MRSQPARRGDLHEANRALTPLAPALLGCLIQFAPTPAPPFSGRRCASGKWLLSEFAALRVREFALVGAWREGRSVWRLGIARARHPRPGIRAPRRLAARPAALPRAHDADKREFQDLARTTLCPATPIHRPRRGLPQRTVPRTRGQPPPRTGPIPCRAK